MFCYCFRCVCKSFSSPLLYFSLSSPWIYCVWWWLLVLISIYCCFCWDFWLVLLPLLLLCIQCWLLCRIYFVYVIFLLTTTVQQQNILQFLVAFYISLNIRYPLAAITTWILLNFYICASLFQSKLEWDEVEVGDFFPPTITKGM